MCRHVWRFVAVWPGRRVVCILTATLAKDEWERVMQIAAHVLGTLEQAEVQAA